MTIVVGGYIVGYPLGGMTWHHLNYLLGLHELGHEVWFYEYGAWPPYDPVRNVCDWDASYGVDYLDEQLLEYGLPSNWCYRTSSGTYNMSDADLTELFERADLLISVSGITPLHDDLPRPRCTVVIDTDPVFTQLRMRGDQDFVNYYKQFDAVATFGKLIGTEHCALPTHGFDWIPTNQPIALRHWPLAQPQSDVFTTIGKWEHSSDRDLEFDGRHFLSSKGVELQNLIDLPGKTRWKLALAMQSMPAQKKDQFLARGWTMLDPEAASLDCRAFQKFIADSAGEITVAKQIYSGIPSGWFSDRSACYLSSGRPVVTQATGFEKWLPTGEGVFGFATVEEAAAALATIASDYDRHTRAARRIAEKHFDSRIVLQELLDRVM